MALKPASAAIEIDADAQLDYAKRLFAAQDYLLAAAEYHRFIYFFPQDPRVGDARFQIGRAYFAARQFEDAIRFFETVLAAPAAAAYHQRAAFMISDSYLALKRVGGALTTLHNLATLADDVRVVDEAHYRIAWIHLESGSLDKAAANFEKISPQNHDRYRLLEIRETLSDLRQPQKSPTLAGILSIVPGGGYAYCGRYQDALIALLLNGGLIYAAYEAFSNEWYGLGAVISFVEIGFYSGNIYGAVASAHKINRQRDQVLIDQLRKRTRLSLSVNPRTRGVEMALSWHF